MSVLNVRGRGIDISADTKKQGDLIPFAVVKALTRTAKLAQLAIRDEMVRVFDRPTPYTLNSTYVRPATKAQPVSSVYLKDDSSKGTPATKYLAPQIEGGTRSQKRFESALQRIGVLPDGWYVIPGKAARLDAYGNWSRGQIVQILAWFQAFGEQGFRANTTLERRKKLARGTKRKRGTQYFAVLPSRRASKWLTPGIYLQTRFGFGSALQPIAIFVSSARYQRRLDFYGIGEKVAQAQFPIELQRALAEERT